MDATSTLTAARAPRRVPTRRVSFEESLRRLPQHFAKDGDLIASHVLASLSSVFPDGEDYFVRSVRYFRDQIDDPELARQVAGFIGQESVHGREHRVFNDRLDELGYPTKRMERLTRWGLAQRERIMSPKSNLAATAALEHFTATLAELVLTDEEARLIPGEPGVRDLFLWHALEESEHKAVAFDVYRSVGGSERVRIITMKLIRLGFIVGMTTEVLVSLAGDPATYERGRLRDSFRRFRRTPMLRREVWDQLRDYDRPDFHPDDRDTDELVEFWREALFGEHGSMVDKLSRAGSVA
ncbi:MAG: metal-dependent hydrolase [Microthrixaceae bacterium]